MQIITTTNLKRELNNIDIRAIANSGVPNVIDKVKESPIPTKIKNENFTVWTLDKIEAKKR